MLRVKNITWIICLTAMIFLLQSCASSCVSRSAENGIDMGVSNARALVCRNTDVMEMYQNSNQLTKGVVLGGATGAIAGSLASEVGFLPGLAIGAILGGAIGAYIDEHTTLLDRLENRGAKIIILGDQVLIVLPSVRVFKGMTSDIRSSAFPLLDATAQLLRCFTKISIKVGAHVNGNGSDCVNRALTHEQANSVVRYLWARGVNARLLVGIGYGGSRPIASCTDPCSMGWEQNYRIEITLEKLPTSSCS